MVLPLALRKNDLVVKSQTGSGKTVAYAIQKTELNQKMHVVVGTLGRVLGNHC